MKAYTKKLLVINMFKKYVKIPEERLKLLKKNTKIIEEIKEKLGVNVKIDDSITIEGDDGLKLMKAEQIIIAFGRGFDAETSLLLLDDEYVLDIINIKDYANSRNRQIELKGRVIGEKGRAKKTIEDMTNTKISVYGKTISIIGRLEDVQIARRAIEMLLEGRMHSTVMKFLEIEKSKRSMFWI